RRRGGGLLPASPPGSGGRGARRGPGGLLEGALKARPGVAAGGAGQGEPERGDPGPLAARRQQPDATQPPAQPRYGEPHRRVHAARTLEARRKGFQVLERRAAPSLDHGPSRAEPNGGHRERDEGDPEQLEDRPARRMVSEPRP